MHKHFILAAALVLGTHQIWAAEPATMPAAQTAAAANADWFFHKDEDDRVIRLQTAVTRFQKGGVTVELVADIHMADEAFHKAIAQRLNAYDVVLYEMLGEPPAPTAGPSTQPASKTPTMYDAAARALNLIDGAKVIDFAGPNMVHADLNTQQLNELLKQRGESLQAILLQAIRQNASAADPADRQRLDEAKRSDNPERIKATIVGTVGKPGSLIGNISGTSVLITERNDRCFEVLNQQIAAGRKRIAVFFGAAHMPDMAKRLAAMGYERVNQEWLTAWDVSKTAAAATAPALPPVAELKPADFEALKTADAFWTFVQKQKEQPAATQTKNIEAAKAALKTWFLNQHTAAEAFAKKYPDDPRHWDAQLMSFSVYTTARKFRLASWEVDMASVEKLLGDVLAAQDASADAKGEAAYFRARIQPQDAHASVEAALGKVVTPLVAFIEQYPEHRRTPEAATQVVQALTAFDVPDGDNLLKRLSAHPNKAIAAAANEAIVSRLAKADLKSKPVELAFKATNGTEVDVAKMRGKVVMVDFWASWCGPCMAEMPNVVKTYQALHEKGFEVIGISLDQEQANMEEAMKEKGMTWPQHFDGKGGENKFAVRFGIAAIPATWLIDKKGMLREVGVRGETLQQAVEKLLAE